MLLDEDVREICREYDIVLAAIKEATPCRATDDQYKALIQLRDELERGIEIKLARLEEEPS